MECLGVCVGASSVSLVKLKNNSIIEHETITHEGDPKAVLERVLLGKSADYVLVTGRKFKEFIDLDKISEPEAIEYALDFLKLSDYDTLISAGGENFIIYSLDKNSKITKVQTGNKCASGTGEFFLQQISRMNLNLKESQDEGLSGIPYKISGRCSVFCKSDCTHALNKGEKKGDIIAGLSKMMAGKILELLAKLEHNKVILVGGTSQNEVMLKYLREKIPEIYIPNEATFFEALGAAYAASIKKPLKKLSGKETFISGKSSFEFHKPLKEFSHLVEFKSMNSSSANNGDVCILGLDVGSTTTKAVLMRACDDAMLASVYLRTNGDPVGASINCYKEIQKQLLDTKLQKKLEALDIKIIGLGVTGSGRHIAGLHALTKGIINEIIAHARASSFFDKDVDTIFEIGGQDAKYTYLTNGVASDYAMNEACSAGTGSFLEESAKETLNIGYTQIADIALNASNPPNFNDQCAAFISSDIKNASHEGLSKEDIVAGLVYSICMNYVNRVKGNRPVGKKIFMQGGVCYNKAVPIAMAALTGKKIIVPPEPGLMGAYGVALEVKQKISLGLMGEQEFSLQKLIERKITYLKPFKCPGERDSNGRVTCDRACEISLLEIEGKKYPFGGACNKYYNQNLKIICDADKNDYVALRQVLVFEKYLTAKLPEHSANSSEIKSVGISSSFVTNTYYPLYYNFFTKLGMKVFLSDDVDKEGAGKIGSSFCYPVEIAHGLFYNLLKKDLDYIFLPHISEIEVKDDDFYKKTCVFVQSENYYLRTAFKGLFAPSTSKEDSQKPTSFKTKILSPVISFHDGLESAEKYFLKLASDLNFSKDDAVSAYSYAVKQQRSMFQEFKDIGLKVLEEIHTEKKFAIVLFGRPYNAFAKEANLGIPRKFASRDRIILPYDFLPLEKEDTFHHMYWGLGGLILRGASFVKKDPLLFGCYITNFSCGPDSFIISYFREIMGIKPSLTLELDSHSADAGVNTRIEAALDIIESFSQLREKGLIVEQKQDFMPTKIVFEKGKLIIKSWNDNGFYENIFLNNRRVKLVLPAMGDLVTRAVACSFKSIGVNAIAMPVPDVETLKFGRANTTCKECLPLILTTGTMMQYFIDRPDDEITLFFMPHGAGPCRQGQYHILQQKLISKNKIKNAAVLSLGDESSYEGLGPKLLINSWISIIVAESLEDMRGALRVLAVDKDTALKVFDVQFNKFLEVIETGKFSSIMSCIKELSEVLSKIPLKKPISQAKFISLVGEAYVRREEFSRMDLIDTLERNDFIVLPVPTLEYIYYCNYLRKMRLVRKTDGIRSLINVHIADFSGKFIEKKIKKILEKSNLLHYELVDVDEAISHSRHLISEQLFGESILTVGASLKEIVDKSCGVISLGPFACMPSRLAESILSREMNVEGKSLASGKKYDLDIKDLPFLAIETDGNPFPQIVQSRIEIFMLQASRLHNLLQEKTLQEKKTRF